MSQSPVTEGPPETPKASAKTPESAKFSSPQVPNDNAATTPRRALPSSRSESQAESSKETPKLAAVPGKKRKSPSKPDGAAAPKAPKLEPADSPCAVDKAIPDTALPSPKTPTVAEAAKDCPAGNEAEPAEAENADDNGGQQPPETPQKGAKPARKPRVNATKAQLTELLKKFEEVNDIVGRHEERFVKQAERVRKLERETRNMSSSLHRLRRWVTVAQSQGAPVPPEIWDELRKSYTAKKETKAAETAQADATANTGENGLDGSACAEDTESEGKAETESDENPRLGEE